MERKNKEHSKDKYRNKCGNNQFTIKVFCFHNGLVFLDVHNSLFRQAVSILKK